MKMSYWSNLKQLVAVKGLTTASQTREAGCGHSLCWRGRSAERKGLEKRVEG